MRDFNENIGTSAVGYEELPGSLTFGKRNADGERVLEFAVANNLVVKNSWFKKSLNIWGHIKLVYALPKLTILSAEEDY